MQASNPRSPFHAGELLVQARAGVRESAARVARAVMREAMPEQHQELFEKLPYLLVATLDNERRPWASFVAGAPGFVRAEDARTLFIGARGLPGDRLMERLVTGAELAVLGIELATRRRNRANGRIGALTADGFALQVEQSFGNCPKHITPRAPYRLLPRGEGEPQVLDETPLLSPRARQLIAESDTFFIASAATSASSHDAREGLDVSHRGGPVGFVSVEEKDGASVLSFLDYSGNNLFNTLGNIAQNPVAGLTFVDFVRGDVLMLTGSATIEFALSEQDKRDGGERKVHVRVERATLLVRALPFAFTPI